MTTFVEACTKLLRLLVPLIVFSGEVCAADKAGNLQFSSPESVLAGEVSMIRLATSPDGNHQLWGEPQGEGHGGLDIRERHKSGPGWDDSQDAPFNTRWNDFDPAFTPDGSGIYFFSDRPGGEGGDDIWFVPLESGTWGEPVNIGPPVNTAGNEWAPAPLADGRLLFSSDGHEGFGGQDLYIAEQNGSSFSAPHNLGDPVNSTSDDYDAVFLEDGTLVFTRSENPGNGSDLYYSCRLDGGFTEPQPGGPNVNLGGGWALGPSVSARYPGVLFFSGRDPDEGTTGIYRVRYEGGCSRDHAEVTMEHVGRQFLFDYGDMVIRVSYRSDSRLEWEQTRGPEAGTKAEEQYGYAAVREDVIFFWWQEKDSAVVAQVVDFTKEAVYTTWTAPGQPPAGFRGKIIAIAADP